MSSKTIFPLLYAAPISFYALYIKHPGLFEIHENFTKQNFRSRCRVYGANGVINLTIPILGSTSKLGVQQVGISNIDPWQRNHWKTIESAYRSSPFFEYYSHLIYPLFQKEYTHLWEFNTAFHLAILRCLDLAIPMQTTPEFNPLKKGDLRAIYSSKKAHPKASQFNNYQQVFSYTGPFESDLSILDGIFNLGPQLESYLLELSI